MSLIIRSGNKVSSEVDTTIGFVGDVKVGVHATITSTIIRNASRVFNIRMILKRPLVWSIQKPYGRLTVCVTGAGADADSAWEQRILEARKMLENAAESHTSAARDVRRFLQTIKIHWKSNSVMP